MRNADIQYIRLVSNSTRLCYLHDLVYDNLVIWIFRDIEIGKQQTIILAPDPFSEGMKHTARI